MKINGIEISNFALVRDYTSRSWLLQNEVGKLIELVKAKTGAELSLKNDKTTEEAEYEILIGNTNRSAKAQSEYGYDDYEIIVSGKKVFLTGGSTYAAQVAVTEFCKMLENGDVTDADSKKGSYKETVSGYDSKSYYKLAWGDEFDGDKLDDSKWSITQMEYKGAQLVVNDRTFEMKDGNAIMRGYKEGDVCYHTDAIQTGGKFRYHGGYIEMRARIPNDIAAYGSFWGNGCNAEGVGDLLEIDIFESFGMPGFRQANLHKWFANHTHWSLDGKVKERFYRVPEEEMVDKSEYHTIAMLWTDDEIHFFYDGNEYYGQEIDEFYKDKFINIYAGFNIGWNDRKAPPEDTSWPVEYYVDYIRLYQIDGQSYIEKK